MPYTFTMNKAGGRRVGIPEAQMNEQMAYSVRNVIGNPIHLLSITFSSLFLLRVSFSLSNFIQDA
jgi:hypothetical protein